MCLSVNGLMKSKTNRFGSSLEGLLHSLYCFSSGDEFEAGGMRFRVSDSAKHENKKIHLFLFVKVVSEKKL